MVMWIILIMGLITFITSFIAYSTESKTAAYIVGLLGAYLIVLAILYHNQDKRPSAIDVYRGKTTLEITYKDGVPTDSVVVFK